MTTVCVCVLMVQGKLQSFLTVAAQTLESFVRSLDEEVKTQTEDHNSQEHQFVLALAGTITSELIASVLHHSGVFRHDYILHHFYIGHLRVYSVH